MRRLAVILGTLLCAWMLPTDARADDVPSLLAKHTSFVGWKFDGMVSSWRASGTRTQGNAIDAFAESRAGLSFRDTLATSGGLLDETGFNGRYPWHADANGFYSRVMGPQGQAIVDFDAIRAEAIEKLGRLSIGGTALVNGSECVVLRAEPTGGLPVDVYENPTTGAFLRVVVGPGTVGSRSYDILNYLEASPGRRFVGRWIEDGSTYDIKTLSLGEQRAAAVMPPVPSARWTYSSESAPVNIQAQSDSLREIQVTATVNGHSGTFLLSTNTPSTIIFDPFAHAAGVKDLGTSDFSPYIGNPQFSGYGRVETLQVGSAVERGVIVQRIVAPTSKIAGVLGYDFFAGALVNVDLRSSTLQVLDPNLFQAAVGSGAFRFPVDLTGNTPAIALSLPKGGVAHPVLDTGLAGFIILAQPLRDAGQVNGPDITSTAPVLFGGIGATGDPIASTGLTVSYTTWNLATTSGTCITLARLLIGPYPYENPPLCFGGANVFGQDGGAIGLDFLRHFNWTIDYPHSEFVLTPNGL